MDVRSVMRRGVRRAFSLLEVMLVLTIIAIMTAAVAYNLIGASEKAKIKATRASMAVIQQGIKSYQLDKSTPPPALLTLLEGGKMAILDDSKKLKDAWGEDFIYSPNPANGRDYQLFSKGSDKVFQTADDLDVWKAE